MADGVDITAGSGTTIATDDAGASGHVQIVKLARSTDGSATALTADADGLLVNLGTNNDVTVTGTVTATGAALESGGNLAAAATSLAVIDDWDESDRAKVNPIVGQAGVAAGAGSVDATVQRVTIADDDAILSVIALSMGYLVGLATSSTATAVSLASTTSSAQLVAANSDRKGLTLTNTDANRVYVNFGAAASATAFAFFLDEGDYWEMAPATRYLGAINAIWTGDGSGALIGQEFD